MTTQEETLSTIKRKLSCELQSVFLTQFHGHGFVIRDYIRDYT